MASADALERGTPYIPQQTKTVAAPTTTTGSSGTGGAFAEEGASSQIPFDPTFGASNQEFYEQEFGGDFGGMAWQEMLWARLPKELALWAEQNDQDPGYYVSWMQSQFSKGLLPFITNQMYFMFADLPGAVGGGAAGQEKWANSPQGLATIHSWAWNWMGMQQPQVQRPRPSGGGGGGGRGPTAAEIRAQFDVDQLTNRANEVWQSFLLEDNQDARSQAKAYVEAIVRNPKQKLDFDTFIEQQAKATGRYASIYRSLPDGMDPRQYIQPYMATALQFIRPEEAADVSIGAAQFGADPAAFRSRLGRTDAVTGSAPFIQGLEGRLASLSKVLRG